MGDQWVGPMNSPKSLLSLLLTAELCLELCLEDCLDAGLEERFLDVELLLLSCDAPLKILYAQ